MNLILGIESSCDETACALITVSAGGSAHLVAEQVASQIEMHAAYGGVVPELAAREHLKNIPLVLAATLSQANATLNQITHVAVTSGPGLKGCLLIGMCFAQGLAKALNIPLLAINHIEGHLLAPMLDNSQLKPPFLSLVVSGGHTEIVEVRGVGDYKIWARTLDDAAGEAFDKAANLLGIPYPGGASLARHADSRVASAESSTFTLPKVMRASKDFSFSGLKTAIALLIRREAATGELDSHRRAELCFVIQESIVDTLVQKLKLVMAESKISTVTLTGGVSANRRLREKVSALRGVTFFAPKMEHCVDNAAMIAFVGAMRTSLGRGGSANNFTVRPRWPVEECA